MRKSMPFVSAGVFVVASLLPALAQSERYPTEAELQQLRQELRQNIPRLEETGIYSDRRTPEQREARDAYAAAWAEVDPAIAPYLGEWTAIEESLYIYPSVTPEEICVLDVHLEAGNFYTGQIRNGNVYTTFNVVFFLEDKFLSFASVFEGQPNTYEFANPRPLPETLDQLEQYYPEAIAAFHEAGCLTGLPD